jgi:hypothetical protein
LGAERLSCAATITSGFRTAIVSLDATLIQFAAPAALSAEPLTAIASFAATLVRIAAFAATLVQFAATATLLVAVMSLVPLLDAR